jgi:fructokinase
VTGPAQDRAQVLCLGEVLIDLIASDDATRLEDVSSFVVRPGGAPANAAVALARLGVPSAFCGVVGDDPFGARLLATLTSHNVNTSRVRGTADADTTIAYAWKDARGDGRFRLVRLADRLLAPEDVDAAGVDRVAAIVIGSVALAAEPSRAAVVRAVEIAVASGIPVCFDVNMRPTLWPDADTARQVCEPLLARSTLAKLSLDDARFLFAVEDGESAMSRLESFGAPFTVLTDGARGAWFVHRERSLAAAPHFVPAFSVEAIEPTGAGDAFTAAVIARLIAHDWQEIHLDDIVFAAAAGALTTTRRGAIDSLPTTAEVEAFLAARNPAE